MQSQGPRTPQLSKGTVALTFKFDCDRFLRYRLATDQERSIAGVPSAVDEKKKRPGIALVTDQGHLWEAQCYDDVVELGGAAVEHNLSRDIDNNLRRQLYLEIRNLQELLKREKPPTYIIEAEFRIPLDMGGLEGLEAFIDTHPDRLAGATGRPDLMWVQPFDKATELLPGSAENPEFIIHIFDVKLAAEPSLRHFVEVTYYAFGLQGWLRKVGLNDRYAVAAAGRVWPGTHDWHQFKNLVREKRADGEADPFNAALLETTHTVPHEVYWPRVREFLNERVPSVLLQGPHDTDWHVAAKCQLCDFSHHCRAMAQPSRDDHLSQLPGLTGGQVSLLKLEGISTLHDLRTEFAGAGKRWAALKKENHRFRAEDAALRARVEALATGKVLGVSNRKTTLMPSWADRQIFLTTHFDPGTGLSFAFGARSVYFPPGHSKGDRPLVHEQRFIVDELPRGDMADSEKRRFLELCVVLRRWLNEVYAHNEEVKQRIPNWRDRWREEKKAQIYLWDQIEAKQFGRVLLRHMNDPDVLDQAHYFMKFFPAEGELRDPEQAKQSPVTVVRPIVKQLLALPEPFDYGIWRTRYWLRPVFDKGTGEQIYLRPKWGFQWDMSDQIPFERGYELWHGRIYLKRFSEGETAALYTRGELVRELEHTVDMFCQALEDVVVSMQRDFRDRLLLRKAAFSLDGGSVPKMPIQSRTMLTHAKLNAIAQDLENRELLARPIEEREATFTCIRGLAPISNERAQALLAEAAADLRYVGSEFFAFTFSDESRDTRLGAGDFLVVLRNESSDADLDDAWYRALPGSPSWADASRLDYWPRPEWLQNAKLKSMLQVSLARLDTVAATPVVVVAIDRDRLRLLRSAQLIDFKRPMVLDPYSKDFAVAEIEAALKALGNIKKTAAVKPRRSGGGRS